MTVRYLLSSALAVLIAAPAFAQNADVALTLGDMRIVLQVAKIEQHAQLPIDPAPQENSWLLIDEIDDNTFLEPYQPPDEGVAYWLPSR